MIFDLLCPLFYIRYTYNFEENDGDSIVDHSLSENDREKFGLHDWTNQSEGCNWICRWNCSAIFDDQTYAHKLIGFILSDGDDPFQFVNEVRESENGAESNDSSQKSKEEDVFEVPLEILFFEVVASCKDHGW